MVMVNGTRCPFGHLQQYTRVIDICLTEKPIGTKLGINSQHQLASFRGNVRASLNLECTVYGYTPTLLQDYCIPRANKATTQCPNPDNDITFTVVNRARYDNNIINNKITALSTIFVNYSPTGVCTFQCIHCMYAKYFLIKPARSRFCIFY